jgi:hypothetical protein
MEHWNDGMMGKTRRKSNTWLRLFGFQPFPLFHSSNIPIFQEEQLF